MMDQIVKVAWELNDNSENRYQLVYEIAEHVETKEKINIWKDEGTWKKKVLEFTTPIQRFLAN